MVPNIVPRGHSFKGVTAYLVHDKNAPTSERVAWSQTYNLHTQDIEKAARWMAWTDANREALRPEGASTAGRKASAGNVYHFSLSWAPDEQPSREQMEAAALAATERLGLSAHQFYMVAHDDTEHPHVHIVASLVDPETGRIANVYKDREKLDRWAHEYEQTHGIKCEARAEKFAALEQGALAYDAPPLAKQISRADHARNATDAYRASDSGEALAAALEAKGLTLARGDRRGFVVVDAQGEIYALARLIEGVKTKEVSERLKGIDREALPQADDLAAQRQKAQDVQRESGGRGQGQEHQQQGQKEGPPHEQRTTQDIADEYVQLAQDPLQDMRRWLDETDERGVAPDGMPTRPAADPAGPDGVRPLPATGAEDVAAPAPAPQAPPPEAPAEPPQRGRKRAVEDVSQFDRAGRIEEAKRYYRVEEHRQAYDEAQAAAERQSGFWAWLTGRKREASEHAEAMRKNLENAQWRLEESIRAIDWYKPESVKQEVLARHGVDGAAARQRQEREQTEHEEKRHERDTQTLKEAAASPERAAELKDAVQPRTAQQRDMAAYVQAKAREHQEATAARKKALADKVEEAKRTVANKPPEQQANLAQQVNGPAVAPAPTMFSPAPAPVTVRPARERFAGVSIFPNTHLARQMRKAAEPPQEEPRPAEVSAPPPEPEKREAQAERSAAPPPPEEAARERRREDGREFSILPTQEPDQGQGLER